MNTQLTHVGSLPFLDPEFALDYTFLYDIPVLFSLPRLDKNQFMGADVLHLLGIEGLSSGFWNSKKEITPFYLDQFLIRADKEKIQKIKFQLIGPYSFYKMYTKHNVSFECSYSFLLQKYKKLTKRLSESHTLLFCIDEPFLNMACDSEIKDIKKFTQELSVLDHVEVGVHCCSMLSINQLLLLTGTMLNLDVSLYQDIGLLKDHNSFLGFPVCELDGPSLERELEKLQRIGHNCKYITPSCGLTFNNIKELMPILKYLKKIQNVCLKTTGNC